MRNVPEYSWNYFGLVCASQTRFPQEAPDVLRVQRSFEAPGNFQSFG